MLGPAIQQFIEHWNDRHCKLAYRHSVPGLFDLGQLFSPLPTVSPSIDSNISCCWSKFCGACEQSMLLQQSCNLSSSEGCLPIFNACQTKAQR